MNTENIDMYTKLHNSSKKYGKSSEKQFKMISETINQFQPFNSILDYGCGKSKLVDMLGNHFNCQSYRFDPAIKEYSIIPIAKPDIVINTDVLEHLNENDINEVLTKIKQLSNICFFTISIVPSVRCINGQNLHITVKPKEWWECILRLHFVEVVEIEPYRKTTISFFVRNFN